jgi:hypothetical protein
MTTLADVFVRVRPDTSKVGPELKAGTEKQAAEAGRNAGHHFGSSMAKAIKAAGIGLAIAGAAIGIKAFSFLKQATHDASDLNETVSKSQNIFPNTQAAIEKFASTSAAALGLSRQQALEGAASFGNFFNQIGIGEAQSAKMSTTLIQLASDLGSFNNANPADVMASFLSATRGEYDSLQKFIPTVNAAAIQTEALRQTHKKSVKDLTDADKATALYTIAFRDAGKAQGDFARTADGAANASRTFAGKMADLRGAIGTALLPVLGVFYQQVNTKILPALNDLWARHGPAVVAFMTRLAQKIGEIHLDQLADHAKALVSQFKASTGSGTEMGGSLASISESGQKLLPVIKQLIADMPSVSDALSVTSTVMGFLADHTDTLIKLMPVIISAFVAYKVAQAAANVAQLISIPAKIAEVVVNRQLISSNRALIASRVASTTTTEVATVATVANTTAENVGILARARAVVGMIASRAAMIAVRGATLAWVGVQWLLNVALTANPIGLVVLAIAALVAGIIYAYNHSETFRKIVQAAFKAIQVAIAFVVDWVKNVAIPFVVAYFQFWIDKATQVAVFIVAWVNRIVGWVTGLRDRVYTAAAGMWDGIVASAKGAINKVLSIWNSLDIGLNIGPIPDWVPGVGGKRFTIPDLFPDLPLLARGGIIDPRPGGTMAVLGEAGKREIATPEDLMRAMIAEAVAAGGRDVNVKLIADNQTLAALFRFVKIVVEQVQDDTARALAAGVRG